jgi:hypothetical protein
MPVHPYAAAPALHGAPQVTGIVESQNARSRAFGHAGEQKSVQGGLSGVLYVVAGEGFREQGGKADDFFAGQVKGEYHDVPGGVAQRIRAGDH